MSASGLGTDGYLRIQKESSWGTGVTSSMTLLPILAETNIQAMEEFIENQNVLASRLEQAPNAGRIKVAGDISMDMSPSLFGLILNLFLGASTDGSVSDSTYEHTWLVPLSGERVSKSFTCQQARGGDTAEQYVGGMIYKLSLKSDNQGKISLTVSSVFKNYSTGVSRISSFSYPSEAPYNFSHFTVNLDPVSPTNDAAFDQLCESFEFDIELGYDIERFKLGSRSIYQPVFNGKPKSNLKLGGCDAEAVFAAYARSRNTFQIDLQLLHTEYAAGTTPFRTQIEIPVARLKPETVVPNGMERLKMDLDFNCSYGGTSTGGGSANQMVEIRHRDATASYS